MFEFPPEEGFDVEIIPVTRTVIYNSKVIGYHIIIHIFVLFQGCKSATTENILSWLFAMTKLQCLACQAFIWTLRFWATLSIISISL